MAHNNNLKKKKYLIIGLELIIGLLHVVGIGRHSSERMFNLTASYFSDLVLPFGFYFLLIICEENAELLKHWWVKSGIIFFLASFAEVGQYFALYTLGRTFDPLDFIAYAIGVLLASLVDRVFSVGIKFWKSESLSK